MTSTNAERQRRYRERRIKSGEMARLEFRVTKRQAETFDALATRWETSKTKAFLRLCQEAETPGEQPRSGGHPLNAESIHTFPTLPPASREELLQRVDSMLVDIGNWIAWSATEFDGEEKELVYRLSADVAKLARRIERRYPDNKGRSIAQRK